MSKYRIIHTVSLGGEERYYIQYRFLWIFWLYATETRSYDMLEYRIAYHDIESAHKYVQWRQRLDKNKSDSRIVSRNIIKV